MWLDLLDGQYENQVGFVDPAAREPTAKEYHTGTREALIVGALEQCVVTEKTLGAAASPPTRELKF